MWSRDLDAFESRPMTALLLGQGWGQQIKDYKRGLDFFFFFFPTRLMRNWSKTRDVRTPQDPNIA